MKGLIRIALVIALVAPATHGAPLWLHIRVTEAGSHPATVKINLPYALVERAAPLVESEHVGDGEIVWNGDHVELSELRETWRALRAGKRTITRDDASWTIVRDASGETLVVHELDTKSGAVVRIPARLVDALLSGSGRLDFSAAVKVIAQLGSGELVAVDEDGSNVRIWVDSTPEAE
ncbi:MAG: hypothetical protein HYU52_03875 [Acidobacteria bacterium]|nr:hypothetical protein [Acidobacteriota bacterium]